MNQAKPEVKITLDRERTMRFDMNAMVVFEAVSGKNVLKMNWQSMNITDIRALLWACLHGEDKALTLETAGSILSLATLDELTAKLQEVINSSMPVKKADETPLPTNSPSGTG